MGLSPEILKRYGLPTAIAVALAGLVIFLVEKSAAQTERDLEFLMRLVDTMCVGGK